MMSCDKPPKGSNRKVTSSSDGKPATACVFKARQARAGSPVAETNDRGARETERDWRGEENTGVSTNPQTVLAPAHGERRRLFRVRNWVVQFVKIITPTPSLPLPHPPPPKKKIFWKISICLLLSQTAIVI